MGYVFDFKDAAAYDQWSKKDGNQKTIDLENQLMVEMVHPGCGDRLVDIGCGAGSSLMPFMGKGIQLTGVDPSPYMIDIAREKIGHRVDFHRAFAEDLPFDDNSFEYACLCLSLEFTKTPKKALEEACRVAKDGVFVGILNKYSLKAFQRRIKGVFVSTVYNHARFFSINEVQSLFKELLGDVPIKYRTICHFPGMTNRYIDQLESLKIARKSPLGSFVGVMANPVPKYRTRPMTLKSRSANTAPSGNNAVSCAENYKNSDVLDN